MSFRVGRALRVDHELRRVLTSVESLRNTARDPTRDTASERAEGTCDRQALSPLFDELRARLRANDHVDATVMRAIVDLLGDTAHGESLSQLCGSVNNMDYDAAIHELEELVRAVGLSNQGDVSR